MKRVQPLLATDFYKVVHHKAYKEGMQKLVSYFTPRMSRIENCEEVVVFGITSTATIPAIYWLEEYYNADIEKEGVGFGTASMEHSVMCTYGKE